MPNPVVDPPAPSEVVCKLCFGWGTTLEEDKASWAGLRTIQCEKCTGTGRIQIPKTEIEQCRPKQ